MFSITVALKNNPVVWTLLYKEETTAITASAALHGAADEISLNDDFGQTLHVDRECLAGVLTEDLDKSKMAYVERTLHIERCKVAAQRAAQADPAIKTAIMTQHGGPAMFNPVGNGRG